MFFSVIVPIYKVEPYLCQCVDSVLGQTFPEFELILVDDGSPDACPAICDEYAARDQRVRVIHKENGGLVSARQAGVEIARGEYIVNVDGDDWIAPKLLEYARKQIVEYEVDIVTFAVADVYGDRETVRFEPVPEGLYAGERLKREIWRRMLMAPDMSHMFYYLCGKVIRRTLLYRHQMAVDQGISLGEDVTCLMPVYREAARVFVSAEKEYFCRCRLGSDSRSFRMIQYEQLILGVRALEAMQGAQDFEQQIHRYVSFLCFGLLNGMIFCDQIQHLDEVKLYMLRPELRNHLQAARFRGITPKMRVTYFCFRRGWTGAAFWFLRMCQWLKRRMTECH